MSDRIDDQTGGDGPRDKHGDARAIAEAALRAREAGDGDRAELLMEQARRADPQAVEDLLQQADVEPDAIDPAPAEQGGSDAVDHELELMTTQVQPHADAPSRAGITGSGSGADGQE